MFLTKWSSKKLNILNFCVLYDPSINKIVSGDSIDVISSKFGHQLVRRTSSAYLCRTLVPSTISAFNCLIVMSKISLIVFYFCHILYVYGQKRNFRLQICENEMGKLEFKSTFCKGPVARTEFKNDINSTG